MRPTPVTVEKTTIRPGITMLPMGHYRRVYNGSRIVHNRFLDEGVQVGGIGLDEAGRDARYVVGGGKGSGDVASVVGARYLGETHLNASKNLLCTIRDPLYTRL